MTQIDSISSGSPRFEAPAKTVALPIPTSPPAAAAADPPVILSINANAAGNSQTRSMDLSVAGNAAAASLRHASKADAGAEMREALDDASRSIEWILKALGMEPEATRKADGAVRDKFRARMAEAASVRVEARVEETISVEVRNLEISFSQGDSTVRVEVASISFSYQSRTTVERQVDPLVLDLSGDGIHLARPGKWFDVDGDGAAERTSWVQGDDALLAIDRDGDGAITSGHELFGQANGHTDGFGELSTLDANGDGVIDATDPGYRSLVLLREYGRLDRLDQSGISRIRLDLVTPVAIPAGGGMLAAASLFERGDGRIGLIGDALFDVTA